MGRLSRADRKAHSKLVHIQPTSPKDTGPQPTFTPSSTYSGELQRTEPVASGQQWVGYVSQYVNYSPTGPEQNFTATADFGLPTANDGAPFAGPFTYQLVVGGRQYIAGGGTTPSADEAIDGQSNATGFYSTFVNKGTSYYNWISIDDSSPSTVGANASLATRDAGIVPGKSVRVIAGQKAAAHFKSEYNGSSPGASLKLSARTTVRRTKATATPRSITPTGTSTTPVTATMLVPVGARAGTYKVTLTARLPDGESRSGTVLVVVKAARKAKKAHKRAPSRTFTG